MSGHGRTDSRVATTPTEPALAGRLPDMEEFVSEPITPRAGTFDSAAMATGVPGLPDGFTWRDETQQVKQRLETWKQSAPEGGRAGAERYLRRHYFRLRMDDDSIWTVYFTRQTPRTGSPKTRWFLYSIQRPG